MKIGEIESILEGRESLEFRDFGEDWLEKSDIEKKDVKENIRYLVEEKNVSKRKISQNLGIVSRKPEDLKETFRLLESYGLSQKKISTNAYLLGLYKESIKENYKYLRKLGLSKKKIASRAGLLGRDLDTIKKHKDFLTDLDLTEKKICYHPELLELKTKTVKEHYDNLRRFLSPEKIISGAHLLSNSKETINANVQFLSQLGIDYKRYGLLSTKPSTKRKKFVWLYKEIFDRDYDITRDFISRKTKYLAWSTSRLEENRNQILEEAENEGYIG